MDLRKEKNQRIILFFATFVVAFIVRLLLFHSVNSIESWSGFKYMHQLGGKHLNGESSSLIIPYLKQFTWLFNDIQLAFKLGTFALTALFALSSLHLAVTF